MQYLILAYEDQDAFDSRQDPTRAAPYRAAWAAYVAAIRASGVLAGAGGLQPPETATSVRIRGGERLVQDGPYADTKEQLGGYFVIDVPDLDAALEWAERCPSAAYATVEIRPLMPPMPGPA